MVAVAVAATTALLICRHGDIIGHVTIKHTGGACKNLLYDGLRLSVHLFCWVSLAKPHCSTSSPNDSFSSFLPFLIPCWLAGWLAVIHVTAVLLGSTKTELFRKAIALSACSSWNKQMMISKN
ncbi:hypothetical protein V6N13_099808 [Hibiscus sabdariffa]|uniref:Secreted protein n=1 Tax=Hibiscus sabdariffa TaxID=183260 RepID=A0ABR2NMD7_9ROSI